MLGDGGTGVVYRASHLQTGRAVALKILHAEIADDETMRARFLREARVGARLEHVGAVSVLDFDSVDGRSYLVMELVEGPTLRDLFGTSVPTRPQIAKIFAGLLDLLEVAHAEGIVHRDLKPTNIKVLDCASIPRRTRRIYSALSSIASRLTRNVSVSS